eukprot:8146054-Alexandrium_andersonii.AAC.1
MSLEHEVGRLGEMAHRLLEDPGGPLGGQAPAQHLDVEAPRSDSLDWGRLVILPTEESQGGA